MPLQATKNTQQKYCGQIAGYKIINRHSESGSQATILVGEDQMQNKVIIKIFKEAHIFMREAQYMQQIGQHSNVINVLDILQRTKLHLKKKNLERTSIVNAIVMEMGKVDLFKVLQQCENFAEEVCRYYFKQLLSALTHCHEQGVAHCDLKLENIIFDNSGNTKLIDFGLAHGIKENGFSQYRKCLGTYGYMAPEVHNSEFYDIKHADLFSLAVILFVMVYGSPPFGQAIDTDAHYHLMQNDQHQYRRFMRSLNPTVSSDFEDFILKMLNKNTKNRLSVEEIKKHSWYNGKTSTYKEAVVCLNDSLMQAYQSKY